MTDEIWIADDDRGVRFVLAEALRDAGLAVREFGDVGAVRDALRESRPALLVTDVRMPGEDGLQLLDDVQRIRHIPATIVQGRYDIVCPATSAWDLHRVWPEAEFRMVPDAGHSAFEPGNIHELVSATDRYRSR